MRKVEDWEHPTDPEGQLLWLSQVDTQIDAANERIEARLRKNRRYGIEEELFEIPESELRILEEGKVRIKLKVKIKVKSREKAKIMLMYVRRDVRKEAHRLLVKLWRLHEKVEKAKEEIGGKLF